MNGFVGFILGAFISGGLFVLVMIVSMNQATLPPGQQDSGSIATGIAIMMGTPCIALIGGLIGIFIANRKSREE